MIIRYWFFAGLCLIFMDGRATPVNINTADAHTLADSLSGIGLKKAEAIVNYRQANGLFKTPEDLDKVKGIGAKTVQKNKPDILLNEPNATVPASDISKPAKK